MMKKTALVLHAADFLAADKQTEKALHFARARNARHRLVIWNELGEDKYLVPTQGDREAIYLRLVGEAKKSGAWPERHYWCNEGITRF